MRSCPLRHAQYLPSRPARVPDSEAHQSSLILHKAADVGQRSEGPSQESRQGVCGQEGAGGEAVHHGVEGEPRGGGGVSRESRLVI